MHRNLLLPVNFLSWDGDDGDGDHHDGDGDPSVLLVAVFLNLL